jgi:hypothetical protein
MTFAGNFGRGAMAASAATVMGGRTMVTGNWFKMGSLPFSGGICASRAPLSDAVHSIQAAT